MATRSSDLQQVVARSQGFDGGVNLRDTVAQLAANELRISENGTLDERGGWSKRLGCSSHGTFGGVNDRIISSYTFYRGTSGTPQVLIHTSAGILYYTNDPTANPIVWTQIVAGLSTTAPMSFETFNGKCYFSNGVDNYASWDGATYTTFPSAPKGKYIRLWKDTMWSAGATADRVYSSSPGDAETWPVASWVDIAKGDGDQLMGLGTDGLVLMVGKRNRMMTIYDPTTFANRVTDFEKGLEGHFTIVQFESEIYYLTRRGIARFDESGPAAIISAKLDPLFDPSVLNLNALNYAYAYTFDNRVGWSLPEVNSTIPTLQIEYYPRLGPISQYTGVVGIGPWVFHRMPASTFTRYRSGAVEYLFGGHFAANKFLQLFAPVGTDDGAIFTAIMETGAYDFGAPTRTKYIRRIRVLGRGNVVLQIRKNFQSAIYKTVALDMASATDLWSIADTWGSGSWGPDSLFKEALANPDAYGRYFQLRFTDASDQTSRKLLEVGSREYALTAGEWAIYLTTLEGEILGVRD